MSYNYLPLDRKWLHFQQVKNLLDYNQLVSITFDAHERILACSEWLDNQSIESNKYLRQIEQSPVPSLTSNLVGIGDEVPIDIVKLMLMLKIKSLSYGYSGVHIETVKRLMEMYNNGVLPVIYPEGAGRGISDSALSQLALPLTGMGQVHFRGKIRKSSKVLEELDWQPVKLSSLEAYALSSGTHFISAYGMFILKQTEQLLKAADVIAALTFNACGYTIKDNDEEIDGLNNNKGGKNTASIIFKFLNSPESAAHNTGINRQPYSFDSTPKLHDVAKESFDCVLNTFLKAINSVSESPVILSKKNLVVDNENINPDSLSLALDMLSICMTNLLHVSERRISQLARDNKNLGAILLAAASIVSENKQLSSPASVDFVYLDDINDFVHVGHRAAIKCLQVVNNVEKILGLELLSGTKTNEFKRPVHQPPFLEQLLSKFRQQIQMSEEDTLQDDLMKAMEFIRLY